MRSTKAVATAGHRLLDIPHKILGERWLCLSLHLSSEERATLIDHHDVALGGRQVNGRKGEKNA